MPIKTDRRALLGQLINQYHRGAFKPVYGQWLAMQWGRELLESGIFSATIFSILCMMAFAPAALDLPVQLDH
jgi:hypothetical protein